MQNMRHDRRSCCSQLALMCVTVPISMFRVDRRSEKHSSQVCPVAPHVSSHVAFTACYTSSIGGCADLPSTALLRSRVDGKRREQIPSGASLCFFFCRGRRAGVRVYPNKLAGLQMEVKQYEGRPRAVMLTYKNSSVRACKHLCHHPDSACLVFVQESMT